MRDRIAEVVLAGVVALLAAGCGGGEKPAPVRPKLSFTVGKDWGLSATPRTASPWR
jgi:hypothetical protein